MSFSIISTFVLIIILIASLTSGNSSVIEIQNNCNHDIWAAAVPGGGKHLSHKEIWRFAPPNKKDGKEFSNLYVWGRTNCTFNDMGQGKCATGDCDGFFNCDDNFFDGPDWSDWNKPREFATSAYFMFDRFDMRDLLEMDSFGIWFSSGYNIPMQLTAICNQRLSSIIGFKYSPSINGNCFKDIEGCDVYCTIDENKHRCYQTCQSKLDAPSFCPPKDPISIIGDYAFPTGENQFNVLFCP